MSPTLLPVSKKDFPTFGSSAPPDAANAIEFSVRQVECEQPRYGRIRELSRALLNLAERDGRASYPQFTAPRGIPT